MLFDGFVPSIASQVLDWEVFQAVHTNIEINDCQYWCLK